MKSIITKSSLIVFSLEKWNSMFTRTSQIMSRFARYRNVYYIETPVIGVSKEPVYLIRETQDDVKVVEPYLPLEMSVFDQKDSLKKIISDLMENQNIEQYSIWSNTPKAIPFIRDMKPKALIYDCIADYSTTNPELEKEMFELADVVVTNSHSLYAAKHTMHSNIHIHPDSIDFRHFYQARKIEEELDDLSSIPHPRIGFAGAIDESIDLALVEQLATLRPDWHFILAGDIQGIEEDVFPKRENIHFLSHKSYAKLPFFLSGIDCTFLPYKVNEKTQHLNPALIIESLVAQKPVVSVPLPDIITVYSEQNMILLGDFPHDIISRLEYAMNTMAKEQSWKDAIDHNLMGVSWDKSCLRLSELEQDILEMKRKISLQNNLKQILHRTFRHQSDMDSAWIAPRKYFVASKIKNH